VLLRDQLRAVRHWHAACCELAAWFTTFDRGYLSDNLYFRLMNLANAAIMSTTNLMLSKQRDARNTENRSR
jgi:hypothetical protein